jgi:hypothetical protein
MRDERDIHPPTLPAFLFSLLFNAEGLLLSFAAKRK